MNLQTFLFTIRPFTCAAILLGCAWGISWPPVRASRATVWALVLAGFAAMAAGFAARIAIARSAPVTNLYESLLGVAFGVLVFVMIFQSRRRSPGVFRCALPVAAAALVIADLPWFDAALRPLAPILRQPLWLASHVLTVTLGYAAFALALGLGHRIVWRRARGRPLPAGAALQSTLRIGVARLGAGILLGAFWARFAWGRFWGWDPKETWALISLLCYLVLLHGNFAGWWGDFGLAAGSIAAFQTIVMTWYGVNFLPGRSLHAYGSGAFGFRYLLAFALAEALFILVAIVLGKKPPNRSLTPPNPFAARRSIPRIPRS